MTTGTRKRNSPTLFNPLAAEFFELQVSLIFKAIFLHTKVNIRANVYVTTCITKRSYGVMPWCRGLEKEVYEFMRS